MQLAEAVRHRLCDEHREAQKTEERRNQRRESLIRAGIAYVSRELQAIGGIEPLEQLRIEMATRQRLSVLTGSETRAQVNGLVDDILDEEGFEVIDDEGHE